MHWEELSVVCSPTMVLPAPSAVTIWVSPLHFCGCLWQGEGGFLWCDPVSGNSEEQAWKILLLGLGRWEMGCKAAAKLTRGSMWGGISGESCSFEVIPDAKSSKEMGEKWGVQVHCRRAA